MQEPQRFSYPDFTVVNNLNSSTAAEQLSALVGQHALVAEQLRRLFYKQGVVELEANATWNSLANQVARLRSEVENFKCSFVPMAEPTNALFIAQDSVKLLFIKK